MLNLPASVFLPDGPLVQTIRARLPEAFSVYAFGSRLNATADAQSDLDLAVLVPGYVPPLALWDLSSALADLAQCPVDLVDLRAASTVMQFQILTTGRVLWSCGLKADLFETYVLSEKLDLDDARAGLLDDIARSGRVYAR
jgi:uncharacterized protein